jgi:hypothetical protein
MRSRGILRANLARVNDAAKRARQTRFTAPLHHVDVEAIERASQWLRWRAAPGLDGMTVEVYAGDLEANLHHFRDRLHGGPLSAAAGSLSNSRALGLFRLQAMKAWRWVLLRRSQRPKLSWERFNAKRQLVPAPIAGGGIIIF